MKIIYLILLLSLVTSISLIDDAYATHKIPNNFFEITISYDKSSPPIATITCEKLKDYSDSYTLNLVLYGAVPPTSKSVPYDTETFSINIPPNHHTTNFVGACTAQYDPNRFHDEHEVFAFINPDTDNDGVLDISDHCPYTRLSSTTALVDTKGCEVFTGEDWYNEYHPEYFTIQASHTEATPGTTISATCTTNLPNDETLLNLKAYLWIGNDVILSEVNNPLNTSRTLTYTIPIDTSVDTIIVIECGLEIISKYNNKKVNMNRAVAITIISPPNNSPTANDDSAAVNQADTVNVNLAGNDIDLDDGLDLTSIVITSNPRNGSVVVKGDGTIDYKHDGSETLSDSYTYTIDDNSGATSNTATVDIIITLDNTPLPDIDNTPLPDIDNTPLPDIDTNLPIRGTKYFTYDVIDENEVVLGQTPLYCTEVTQIPPGTHAALTVFELPTLVTIHREPDITKKYTIPEDYQYSTIRVQCRVDVTPIDVDLAVSNTYDQPIIDSDNDGINDYHDICPLDPDDSCQDIDPMTSSPNTSGGGPADPNNNPPRDLGTNTNDDTNTSTPVKQIRKSNGGCADCTPPTLGLDKTFKRVVDNGFTYNGNTVQVEKWYTEFPLINATVGEPNLVEIKVYENHGINNMKWVQFCLGAEEKGQPLNSCEVLIEVHLLTYGTTTDIGVKEIIITDKENLIENDTVTSNTIVTNCMENSISSNCVQVDLEYTYREETMNHMMIVNVADKPRNSQNFHFNEGINVIGESLNEPPTITLFNKHASQQKDDLWITYTRADKRTDTWLDESGIEYHRINDNLFDRITPQEIYQCTDPPLDEVKVWKRTNCHFRALTDLWSYP